MNNEPSLEERVDIYDKITGEILKETPEEMVRNSSKFMSLCEAFEIDAGNMEANIEKVKEEEVAVLVDQYQDNSTVDSLLDVISTDNLKDDIKIIRDNLRNNVKAIGTILGKFGSDLIATHADDVSGSVLMGYSELVKSHTTSMKLLIDIHKTAAETLVQVKKIASEAKDIENEENGKIGTVNNTINFTGTPAELLESLKNN